MEFDPAGIHIEVRYDVRWDSEAGSRFLSFVLLEWLAGRRFRPAYRPVGLLGPLAFLLAGTHGVFYRLRRPFEFPARVF